MVEVVMNISTPQMEAHQWEDLFLALLHYIIVIVLKVLLERIVKRMHVGFVIHMRCVNMDDVSVKKVIWEVVKSALKRVCVNQIIHV